MNRSGHTNIKILKNRTVNWRESFTACVAALDIFLLC